MDIKDLYLKNLINTEVVFCGWVKSHRKQSNFGFIHLYDGTNFKGIQVVYDKSLENYEELSKVLAGASLEIRGTIIKSDGKQELEVQANRINVIGHSDETYPIQPKRHSREFLRSIAYLRPRTNLFNAIFKIRSVASRAIHEYFYEHDYLYFHAPIITATDGEGAGNMFQVTTLDLENGAMNNKLDYSEDFFGKKTSLTVTGQLEAETFAMAFKKVYTFGPTFRAENSNTKTHSSEFWMIEPEVAFCDLEGLLDIEEDFLKYIVKFVLENASDEIDFLNDFVDSELKNRLVNLLNSTFSRITHKEAIRILKDATEKWEFLPEYTGDIAKEHEKYLTSYFNGPVFITNWPKDIKAFYMKLNEDKMTVAAVDLIVPDAGELMGGSQREENYDLLHKRMEELNISTKNMEWYLNLRRYGSVVHSGFGMGFERLLIYLTGVDNIRDVIPYPRTPGNCEF